MSVVVVAGGRGDRRGGLVARRLAPRLRSSRGARSAGRRRLRWPSAWSPASSPPNPAERFREFKAAAVRRRRGRAGAADLSSNGRWQFWREAVDAFESAPVGRDRGRGLRGLVGAARDVPLFVRNPHSLPLQQAAELGLLGLALFARLPRRASPWPRRRSFARAAAADAGCWSAVIAGRPRSGAAIDWTWEIPAAFGPARGLRRPAHGLGAARRACARDGYWLGVGDGGGGLDRDGRGRAWWCSPQIELDSRAGTRPPRTASPTGSTGPRRRRRCSRGRPSLTRSSLCWRSSVGTSTQALVDLRQAESRDSEDWRLPLIEARLQIEQRRRRLQPGWLSSGPAA